MTKSPSSKNSTKTKSSLFSNKREKWFPHDGKQLLFSPPELLASSLIGNISLTNEYDAS